MYENGFIRRILWRIFSPITRLLINVPSRTRSIHEYGLNIEPASKVKAHAAISRWLAMILCRLIIVNQSSPKREIILKIYSGYLLCQAKDHWSSTCAAIGEPLGLALEMHDLAKASGSQIAVHPANARRWKNVDVALQQHWFNVSLTNWEHQSFDSPGHSAIRGLHVLPRDVDHTLVLD